MLNWVEKGSTSFRLPYAIYLETRNCTAWYYPKDGGVCLGRELTRADAKKVCAEHLAKELAK